jgi:acetyltransferase-like isoleucine patch superfamily enzyme
MLKGVSITNAPGSVRIRNDALIEANVVFCHMPCGAVAVGVPTKVIQNHGTEEVLSAAYEFD